METIIRNLQIGDTFKTKTGNTVYKLLDTAVTNSGQKTVWLVTGGYYISKGDKPVIKL